MNEKEIKRLREMQKAFDGGAVQPDELKQVIDVILGIVKELKTRLEGQIAEGDSQVVRNLEGLIPDVKSVEKRLADAIEKVKGISSKEVKTLIALIKGEMNEIRSIIPTMPDLSVLEAKLEEVKISIPVLKDTILDTPVQIREKVQSLPEGERWNIADVSDLRREIDTLRNELRSIPRGTISGVGGGTRSASVAYYDIPSLDGVTKAFTIPKFKKVIMVVCSSTPFIMKQGTDYTLAGRALTFTSQIDAASTLATDQTVTVIYGQMFGP